MIVSLSSNTSQAPRVGPLRVAGILAVAYLVALSAAAQEPADVLRLHAEARGGVAAIERIQSVEVRLTIEEDWVLEGHYRATRGGDMRIDVFAEGERVFTEALHGGSAWAMQRGETAGSPITEAEAAILWRGVLGNVYGLHELQRQGVDVLVSGPEELDGESYWLVDLKYDDGFEARYYLDAGSFLIARQRSDHALHLAVDPEIKRFETRYSDYREVDGVLFAFLSEKFDLDSGECVQTDRIHSREINSVVGSSEFLMPQ